MSDLIPKASRWLFSPHYTGRLRRVPFLTIAFALLALFLVEGARYKEDRLNWTIGVATAPSVVTAHEIQNAAARMEADILNELDGPPGTNPDLVANFYTERSIFDKALQAAGEFKTYNEEEAPITNLHAAFDDLVEEAMKARRFHEQHDAAELSSARRLIEIIEQELIPAATSLASVNDGYNQRAYAGFTELKWGAFIAVAVGIGALVLYLLSTLVMNRVSFRRGLNLFWLSAAAVAGVYLVVAGVALTRANVNIYNANTNAYPSVVALLEARASALHMRASLSMWMLDRVDRPAYAQAFDGYSAQVAQVVPGATINDAIAQAQAGKTVTAITGALAKELNNITYEGEAKAATQTLVAFQAVLKSAAEIRQLELSGQHTQAVARLTGSDPGDFDYAMERFDDANAKYGALGTTLGINADEQKSSVEAGFFWLKPLEYITPIALVVIVVLMLLGCTVLRRGTDPARYASIALVNARRT